jgi:hypothetical protein
MKTKLVSIFIASLLLNAASSYATVIISETFGSSGDSTANLNNRPNPATTWTAYSGAVNTGWKTEAGQAFYGTAGSLSGNAGINLGTNYFEANPAIYELSVDVTMTGGGGLFGFGFSEDNSTNTNQNLFSVGEPTEGLPWMLLRGDGRLTVRSAGVTDIEPESAVGAYSVNGVNLRLVLDTTGATNWTIDAFHETSHIDLNLADTLSNTYTFNKADSAGIASIGFLASPSATLVMDNVTLTVIPEPSSMVLLLIGAGSLLILRRRNR